MAAELPSISVRNRTQVSLMRKLTQSERLLIGTSEKDKCFYLSEESHNVPRQELISRLLAWPDK